MLSDWVPNKNDSTQKSSCFLGKFRFGVRVSSLELQLPLGGGGICHNAVLSRDSLVCFLLKTPSSKFTCKQRNNSKQGIKRKQSSDGLCHIEEILKRYFLCLQHTGVVSLLDAECGLQHGNAEALYQRLHCQHKKNKQ